MNEYLDFDITAKFLTDAASRGLGSIIHKLKANKGFPFKTYETLYHKCVVPISDYCGSGVWGAKSYNVCEKLQNRAIRSYLGVHRYASKVVLNGETGWILDVDRSLLTQFHMEMMGCFTTEQLYQWIFVTVYYRLKSRRYQINSRGC